MPSTLLVVSESSEDLEFARTLAKGGDLSFERVGKWDQGPAGPRAHLIRAERFWEVEAHRDIANPPFHYVFRSSDSQPWFPEAYWRIQRAIARPERTPIRELIPAATSTTLEILDTSEKQALLQSVEGSLTRMGWSGRILNHILGAIDELILNAVFDGPVDASGAAIHARTPRDAVFALNGRNRVTLELAFDGRYFLARVMDLHGSLNHGKAAEHLARDYRQRNYEVDDKTRSAGIGLSSIIRAGGSLAFRVRKGVSTEAIALFPFAATPRELRSGCQFVSFDVG